MFLYSWGNKSMFSSQLHSSLWVDNSLLQWLIVQLNQLNWFFLQYTLTVEMMRGQKGHILWILLRLSWTWLVHFSPEAASKSLQCDTSTLLLLHQGILLGNIDILFQNDVILLFTIGCIFYPCFFKVKFLKLLLCCYRY